jgi:hypothetical protein
MVQIVSGKLDYSPENRKPNVYRLFTGNAYVNVKGELVMGRGAALAVKTLYPEVARQFGQQMEGCYGIRWAVAKTGETIGVFQVKYGYKDKADLGLITNSARELHVLTFDSPDHEYHMNFPGIGWGGLLYEDVLPIMKRLSDQVVLYV